MSFITECTAHWECITAWSTLALAVFTLFLVGITFRMGRQQVKASKNLASLELTLRLTREYDSEELLATRDRLAMQLLGGGPLPQDAEGLLDFLETVGHLAHRGLIDTHLLWNDFSMPVLCYWGALEPYVRERRATYQDESIYEEVEWLYNFMLREEQKRRKDKLPAVVSREAREAFFRAETHVNVPPLQREDEAAHDT